MAQADDPVSHVIFDMDGVLLDSEPFYTQVQVEFAARYGKTFPDGFPFELKAQMMGKRAIDAGEIYVRELGIDHLVTPEEYIYERELLLDELFLKTPLMPGAERLVRHLHAHGVPFSLATSTHRRHFDLKTNDHKDLFSLFHHITTSDDVVDAKPSPEIYLLAASKWEPAPHPTRCLVIEDAPSGVTAAKAAGM